MRALPSGTGAIVRRYWPDVREFRWSLMAAGGLLVLGIGLQLLQPWPLQWIFDRVLIPAEGAEASHGNRGLWLAAGLLLAIVWLRVGLDYLGQLRLVATGHAVTRALRLRIFRKLVELPPAFHTQQKSGDLLMRLMGDAPMVSTMMVESSAHLALRGLQALATVGVMLWVDAWLTLVLLLFLPPVLWVARWLAGHLTIATRKQRRKEGELADSMQESIGAAAVIQSLGQEHHVVRQFARSNRRSARAGLKTARAAARLSASVEGLLGVGFAVTLLFGSLRVLQPDSPLTPGELLVFLSYVRGLLKPVRGAAKHQARVAKGIACGQRIGEVLDATSEVRQSEGTHPLPAQPKRIEWCDVSYRYPDGTQALRGVSGTLEAGRCYLLSGPSGAGKSTWVALLARLMDPGEGELRLDGTPFPAFPLDNLRSKLGVALQNPVLFGLSVRENLFLGDPDANDDSLWQALRAAGADEFVRALPDGLDEVLGSSGSRLSGGQRQRLCLARALLRDPWVLVLDEPFAHLDVASADVVRATLRQHAARGGVVLIVSHDPSDSDWVDEVWHLEQGQRKVKDRQRALPNPAPSQRRGGQAWG